MKQLQQLINQMCPNGVEWKTLGEVCERITKGTTPHSFTDNGIAFIKTEAFLENGIDKNKLSFIDEETHNGFLKRSILKENDILFAIAGSIGKCVVVNKSILPANTNQALAIIRLKSSVLYRFVFYVLKSMIMTSYIEKKCKTSGQPNLTLELIRDFQIPLPPLAIQSRIVEILDNFTNLTANLAAELALRRKQYENYREKLLSFDGEEDVEWKKVGEVCEIHGRIGWQGLTKKDYRTTGKYLLVTGTDFLSSNKINYNTCVYVDEDRYTQDKYIQLKENDLLITKDGTIGKLAIVQDLPMPATLNGGVFVIRDKTKTLDHRFLMYIMASSHFKNQIEKKHTNGTIKHLTQNLLVSYAIPVPPLAVQKSIVSILDKFTALIENIETELSLRQKQYEYYREELLRFER